MSLTCEPLLWPLRHRKPAAPGARRLLRRRQMPSEKGAWAAESRRLSECSHPPVASYRLQGNCPHPPRVVLLASPKLLQYHGELIGPDYMAHPVPFASPSCYIVFVVERSFFSFGRFRWLPTCRWSCLWLAEYGTHTLCVISILAGRADRRRGSLVLSFLHAVFFMSPCSAGSVIRQHDQVMAEHTQAHGRSKIPKSSKVTSNQTKRPF